MQFIDSLYCKLFAPGLRANRLQYLKGNILLIVSIAFLSELFNRISFLKANKTLYSIVVITMMVLVIYYCSRAFIARLHDIGLSAWYFFAILIVYNIVALKFKAIAMSIMVFWHILAFVFPGKTKNNKYANPMTDHQNNIFTA